MNECDYQPLITHGPIAAVLILELWLGKTPRTKSASILEAGYNLLIWMVGRFRRK